MVCKIVGRVLRIGSAGGQTSMYYHVVVVNFNGINEVVLFIPPTFN